MFSAADFSWHQVFCSDFGAEPPAWLLQVLVAGWLYCLFWCRGHCWIITSDITKMLIRSSEIYIHYYAVFYKCKPNVGLPVYSTRRINFMLACLTYKILNTMLLSTIYITQVRYVIILLHYFTKGHTLHYTSIPLTSTWPHLNSDVGLEEGEY